MKNTSLKKHILTIIIQTIPVLLGIFIALYLDKSKTEKVDQIYIDNIISKAKNQIIKDTLDLSLSIENHLKLTELINENLESRLTFQEIILQSDGLSVSPTNSNFLKILTNSKIEQLEINKASEIFGIIDLVRAKERYEEQIQLTIYDFITDDSKSSKMKFMMLLNDYTQIEKRLLERQKKFIE